MPDVDRMRAKYELLAPVMDERMTRLWAAAEATALGYGGVAAVTEATGILGKRIIAGKHDLEAHAHAHAHAPERHFVDSFITIRLVIARAIARWLPRCPTCHRSRDSSHEHPAGGH
jgi:hypothetical protein